MRKSKEGIIMDTEEKAVDTRPAEAEKKPVKAEKKSADAKKNAKKNNRIGRPPAIVYYPAYFFVTLWYRLRYNIHVDRKALAGRKGPAIVIAPHVSGKDHILVSMGIFPRRPTFVLSEHFMTGKLRGVLEFMRTISKKMFCPDTRAVVKIIRSAREGNTVVLFPEGRLTWYGRSLEVTDGTAELIRQLGVDVFTVTSSGAGMTFPKWAKFVRRGRIDVKTELLIDGSGARSMTADAIDSLIRPALRHDEEKALPGVTFRTKDTTAGLDGILWVCPSCGASEAGVLETSGGHIRCTRCGLDCTADAHGRISGLPEGLAPGISISTVADWYEYCASTVDISVPLVMPVSVSATDAEGFMRRDIGLATLTVTSDTVSVEGQIDGEEVSLSAPASKITAFPITVGDHIDIYFGGRLFLLSPIPDGRAAIIPVAYLDRVTAARKVAQEVIQ